MGFASHQGEESLDRPMTASQIAAAYPDWNPDPWSRGVLPSEEDED